MKMEKQNTNRERKVNKMEKNQKSNRAETNIY